MLIPLINYPIRELIPFYFSPKPKFLQLEPIMSGLILVIDLTFFGNVPIYLSWIIVMLTANSHMTHHSVILWIEYSEIINSYIHYVHLFYGFHFDNGTKLLYRALSTLANTYRLCSTHCLPSILDTQIPKVTPCWSWSDQITPWWKWWHPTPLVPGYCLDLLKSGYTVWVY